MTMAVRLRTSIWRGAGVALLGLGLTACASATGSTPSPSTNVTTRGRLNGAAGTVVQLSPSRLTLATVSGSDVTVTYTSTVPVIDTSTGSYQDITVGACITASGTRDATGGIAVAAVTVAHPLNGSCSVRAIRGGSPRALPSGRARGTSRARPSARASLPPNFAAIRGQVTAVSGTTVTIKDLRTASTETVTVPTTISIDITSQGSDADLSQGVCVLATGRKGASGDIVARTLAIEPPGPSGCFTDGSRGGFAGLVGSAGAPVFAGGGG